MAGRYSGAKILSVEPYDARLERRRRRIRRAAVLALLAVGVAVGGSVAWQAVDDGRDPSPDAVHDDVRVASTVVTPGN